MATLPFPTSLAQWRLWPSSRKEQRRWQQSRQPPPARGYPGSRGIGRVNVHTKGCERDTATNFKFPDSTDSVKDGDYYSSKYIQKDQFVWLLISFLVAAVVQTAMTLPSLISIIFRDGTFVKRPRNIFQKDTEHSKHVCSLLTCCRCISVSSTNKSWISFCLVSSSSRWRLLFISASSFFFTFNSADASVFFFLDLCKRLSVREWLVMVAAHWGGATRGWVAWQEAAAATRSSVCVTSKSEEMR